MIIPGASIGVAVGRPGHHTAIDVLNRADGAVLTAKRAGGNQVITFGKPGSTPNRPGPRRQMDQMEQAFADAAALGVSITVA